MKQCVLTLCALVLAIPAWAQQAPPITVAWNDAIPAGTADHAARALKESPRHQEWVKIKMADGTDLNAFVVYPERADKAGVVIVIHDIRGMADIPARWVISSRKTATSRSCRTFSQARDRTAAAPSRSAPASGRPFRA
jgi:hypothetical protein